MGQPDERGRFGDFGGRFVPEALVPACVELEDAFRDAWSDRDVPRGVSEVLREFVGPPDAGDAAAATLRATRRCASSPSARTSRTPDRTRSTTSSARRCSRKRMGKTRVIAETGAGQHGVATATAAARLGPRVHGLHGRGRHRRQELNVFRMELLGATVVPVTSGSRTLKDAVNEALREWVTCVADTHYCLGSVMGPHPFPWMVREFQSVIGDEAAAQLDDARSRHARRGRRVRRRRIERGGRL